MGARRWPPLATSHEGEALRSSQQKDRHHLSLPARMFLQYLSTPEFQGVDGPAWGVREHRPRAQGPGLGDLTPPKAKLHAQSCRCRAEGGRLGAQHTPAWLRWRSGEAGPTDQAPCGGCQATSRPRPISGPHGSSLTGSPAPDRWQEPLLERLGRVCAQVRAWACM